MADIENKLIVFDSKEIRSVWRNDEWWFSVLDVIEVLTDTKDPSQYFKRIRQRDEELKSYVGTNCTQIALEGKTGKKRKTTIGNTEHIFRIIQSVPSPKAEPFKQWLAKVGYERIKEIENPELAAKRSRQYWKDLGYPDEWIDTRLQSIAVRGQLTDEWKARDVKEGLEYAILTAEISEATFGLKPSEHKEVKDLKRHDNLRDHMTNLELIFTMLGEESTKREAIRNDHQGFEENKIAAQKGGTSAGKALKAYEADTGEEVVSSSNFKEQIAEAKKQKRLAAKEQKKLEKEKKQKKEDKKS